MNDVTIFFFATLRDYTGAKNMPFTLPVETTVGTLKDILIQKYPAMKPARDSMMAAINREYAGDEQVIPLHAEIAFFPPVSGG